MKAEKVIIVKNGIEDNEVECWTPDLNKLPKHVLKNLDVPMNKFERRERRIKVVKTLIRMAEESGWQVLRRLYDEDSDMYRDIYHIA